MNVHSASTESEVTASADVRSTPRTYAALSARPNKALLVALCRQLETELQLAIQNQGTVIYDSAGGYTPLGQMLHDMELRVLAAEAALARRG